MHRGTNHKEYCDLCELLDLVPRILSISGIAEYYLEQLKHFAGRRQGAETRRKKTLLRMSKVCAHGRISRQEIPQYSGRHTGLILD